MRNLTPEEIERIVEAFNKESKKQFGKWVDYLEAKKTNSLLPVVPSPDTEITLRTALATLQGECDEKIADRDQTIADLRSDLSERNEELEAAFDLHRTLKATIASLKEEVERLSQPKIDLKEVEAVVRYASEMRTNTESEAIKLAIALRNNIGYTLNDLTP